MQMQNSEEQLFLLINDLFFGARFNMHFINSKRNCEKVNTHCICMKARQRSSPTTVNVGGKIQ